MGRTDKTRDLAKDLADALSGLKTIALFLWGRHIVFKK